MGQSPIIFTRNFPGIGVDESLIWDDNYLTEAIMKKYGGAERGNMKVKSKLFDNKSNKACKKCKK